jgi:hypothetical protein
MPLVGVFITFLLCFDIGVWTWDIGRFLQKILIRLSFTPSNRLPQSFTFLGQPWVDHDSSSQKAMSYGCPRLVHAIHASRLPWAGWPCALRIQWRTPSSYGLLSDLWSWVWARPLTSSCRSDLLRLGRHLPFGGQSRTMGCIQQQGPLWTTAMSGACCRSTGVVAPLQLWWLHHHRPMLTRLLTSASLLMRTRKGMASLMVNAQFRGWLMVVGVGTSCSVSMTTNRVGCSSQAGGGLESA